MAIKFLGYFFRIDLSRAIVDGDSLFHILENAFVPDVHVYCHDLRFHNPPTLTNPMLILLHNVCVAQTCYTNIVIHTTLLFVILAVKELNPCEK